MNTINTNMHDIDEQNISEYQHDGLVYVLIIPFLPNKSADIVLKICFWGKADLGETFR